MINFDQELNAEQLDVVKNGDGPCLVLAGAGSGKTRAITYRVAYLLEQGVLPENILLVTFTNKAAKEMVERVRLLTTVETHSHASLPWSGTFHHIAYKILKKYAPLIGYQNNFSVLDNEDSKDLIKMCVKNEESDYADFKLPAPGVIFSLISYARNAELPLAEVIEARMSKWSPMTKVWEKIADDYGRRKQEANVMDFDDLLFNLYLLLLKNEDFRNKASANFHYVLVDEYQDTNKIQASIIKMFASVHRNILAVGDDAQSIYSFRAADIQNILGFEQAYPEAKIFRLETNYRSTSEILNLANDIIAHNDNQYRKELKSIRGSGARPEIKPFVGQREEAKFVAEQIADLLAEGVSPQGIAVLFRAAYHSQALEMELAKQGIAYDYRGGLRFFERAHVKDVLAWLRILVNKDDVVAWNRTLSMQKGIGPNTAEIIVHKIKSLADHLDVASLTALAESLPARAQAGWNDWLAIWRPLILTIKNNAEPNQLNFSPTDLISALLESKYSDYLQTNYEDYRDRLQDLEQMAVFAKKSNDLSSFLAETGLSAVASAEADAVDENKIILSTIHQAKGLEWEAVFVINLAAGQFPNEKASREQGGLEEERRLFYVAITRAKKHLQLTYPLSGGINSFTQGPSMFLEEINKALVDEKQGGDFSFGDGNSDDIIYVPFEEENTKPKKVKMEFLKSLDEL